MRGPEDDFTVRLGRLRHSRGGRPRSFVAQVLRATQKAGGRNPAARPDRGRSSFGRGRAAFARQRLFHSGRRVVVKARVVRQGGARSAPLSAHLAYLKRDGVTRDGADARLFDADHDQVDDAAFAERCRDDRHHFRFIVSPEDGGELADLRAFTRDLAAQMEVDLGTKLDWAAVAHFNTDNPHVHLLVRGVADDGTDLVIARDYISRTLRARAEDLATLELGPKPEHAVHLTLSREVGADRWTRLDAEIRLQVDEVGIVDLRRSDLPLNGGAPDSETRRLLIGRLQKLEAMGLATAAGPARWTVSPDAESTLRELGRRNDILRTIHQSLANRGQDRARADFVIAPRDDPGRIVGRLVDKGLHDELTGAAYAVIDATDGRVHHVRLRGVEALEHTPPLGGVVEVRRFGGPEDPRPTLLLAARSDLDLPAQVAARGATWLDHRLVSPAPLSDSGYGAEVRTALEARTRKLVQDGLARRHGDRVVFARELIDTLRRRELETVAARLSAETRLPYIPTAPGDQVAGTYRQRLTLASGRFAMIDDGLGFSLVPWSPAVERQLGRYITGVAMSGGGIDWSFGRKRDLGL